MSGRTTSRISGGGKTGDRRVHGGKSYCSGGGFDSKSSILKLSILTFTPRVNSSGVGGRREFYDPVQKGFEPSPHADV